MNDTETVAAFTRLYDIIRTLRGEHGCPWDKDQTPRSLRRDLMEEAFEAIDAITQNDAAHAQEELGDVLFVAMLIAHCYEQAGVFTLAESLRQVGDKLVRRHPHVFPESDGAVEMRKPVTDSAAVLAQWDRIKENLEGRAGTSVLDSVPQGFPPLLRAYKLLAKAEKQHWQWANADAALSDVQEELSHVQKAAAEVTQCKLPPADDGAERGGPFTVSGGTPARCAAQVRLEAAVGGAFFALVGYARLLGVDASVALDRANRTFYRHFSHEEHAMRRHSPSDAALRNQPRLWREEDKQEP